MYPDSGGGLPHDYKSSRSILATPSNITDDTTSTWGTGAGNAQKLQVSVNPYYSGWMTIRVCFGKRFTSSPETLYVDPQAVVDSSVPSENNFIGLPGLSVTAGSGSSSGGTKVGRAPFGVM